MQRLLHSNIAPVHPLLSETSMHSHLGRRNSLRETCAYWLIDPKNAGEVGPAVLIPSRLCLAKAPRDWLQKPRLLMGLRGHSEGTNAVFLQEAFQR